MTTKMRGLDGMKWDDDGSSNGNDSDSDVCNEGGDSQGLCTDRPAINTNSISYGLGNLHPPYGPIITNYITDVLHISTPKDWQLLLIQAVVFIKNSNKLRFLCIRRTGNGKILPI